MKKLMRLEIIALAVLLVAAVICAIVLSAVEQPAVPAMAENQPTAPAAKPTVPQTAPTLPPETTQPGPGWMTFPADRKLTAAQYFVYDVDQDTFLTISGEQEERIYPASVTKLFTAYVAMQYLEPQTEITAGDALDRVVWGSSVADIQKGDVLTADTMVQAMLLPSGNDAAYLLAYEAGRKISGSDGVERAVSAFVKEMNKQAADLGMTGTHFVNPDGIHDEDHFTSFADLAILGKMALKDETVLKNAGTAREKIALKSGEKEWHNTNALVDPESPYYCEKAVGLKTGQTPSAGSCLLSAFQMDGRNLLIGVFGCPEEEDRFADTLQLFNEAMGIK